MEEATSTKKGQYLATIKQYIFPTLALLVIGLAKLQAVGILSVLYLRLTGKPIYTETGGMGIGSVFTLVLSDMAVGIIYVWIKNIGKGSEEGIDENGELTESADLHKDLHADEPIRLSVKEALKKAVDVDGVQRGFNYLWMSALSSLVVTVLWSFVTLVMMSMFESTIVQNPTMYLSVYMLLTMIRTGISSIIKSGVLSYTVNATMSLGNVFKAWVFMTKNIFRLIAVEIRYILVTVLGLALLLVGAVGTHSLAVAKKSAQWELLVRNYERDRLYGKVNK